MKLALKPSREVTFFDLLNEHVGMLRQAAAEMKALFTMFERLEERTATIQACSRQGAHLLVRMTRELGKAFITPVDREDLLQLSSSLQRVLGFIEGTVRKLPVYRITYTTRAAAMQADVLVRMADVLVQGFDGLSRYENMTSLWNDIKTLEREGDQLVAAAVADLFERSTDVLEVIKWKEIHEDIEETIDRAEDVFDVLETVLVKHA